MLTGEIKGKVDRIWDAFWSGGIANPLEVIEQITYLLFLRRLDELQTLEENKANRTRRADRASDLPEGDDRGRPYADLRWSRFKDSTPGEMFDVVSEHVFPFLRTLGGEDSTYSHHMRCAVHDPDAGAARKGRRHARRDPDGGSGHQGRPLRVHARQDRDAPARTASSARRGTSSQLMVEMTAPTPKDVICDPACGTAGFLVAAGEYLRDAPPGGARTTPRRAQHFHNSMFHGFDFDSTMLRIGSMNMLLHGVEAPDIRYRDSLSEGASDEEERYTLILANPPFAGSLDYETTAKDLLQVVKTKKTELLFLALFLRLLRPGGRAAVIVPDGVLFGSSKAHKELRRILVEDQKLDAVVKLPSGVFRPYAGVSTAILLFTKTDTGGTDDVWFYDVTADGW